MFWKFNPVTGTLDLISSGGGTTFDPNTILTGPTECLYAGQIAPLDVLIDENGNVLTGV